MRCFMGVCVTGKLYLSTWHFQVRAIPILINSRGHAHGERLTFRLAL